MDKAKVPQLQAGPQLPDEWRPYARLQCMLAFELPVPGFKVRDLLALCADQVIETNWMQGDEVPVRVNGRRIASGNFEVLGDRLAVRLTAVA